MRDWQTSPHVVHVCGFSDEVDGMSVDHLALSFFFHEDDSFPFFFSDDSNCPNENSGDSQNKIISILFDQRPCSQDCCVWYKLKTNRSLAFLSTSVIVAPHSFSLHPTDIRVFGILSSNILRTWPVHRSYHWITNDSIPEMLHFMKMSALDILSPKVMPHIERRQP